MREVKTLLTTLPLSPEHFARIEERLPGVDIVRRAEGQETAEDVRAADVIFGNVTPELMRGAENVQWLQLDSAGSDLYAGVVPPGTLLTNASGTYGPAIAEHMLGMALCLMKHFPRYRDAMKRGEWLNRLPVGTVRGCRCLVVGMGDIGGNFAWRMNALGAHVTGVRRTDTRKPDYVNEIYLMDSLDALLPEADVVSLSLPNSAATAGLMDARRLSLMKPGAILLNVGRGKAVDTDALYEALHSGRLGGAGLDVTYPEPLPPEHPLWGEENCLITPHTSGFWTDPASMERLVDMLFDNLDRFLAGEPLRNIVDRETGYRKVM